MEGREFGGREVYSVQKLNYLISNGLRTFGIGLVVEGQVLSIEGREPHRFIILADSAEKFKNLPNDKRPYIKLYYNREESGALLGYEPIVGDKIIVYGDVILFTRTAQLHFKPKKIALSGEGDIIQRLKELKLKWQETYFARPKRAIPYLVKNVFVITSLKGEAKNDVIRTRDEINPGVNLFFFSAIVQGRDCPKSISTNIALANKIFSDITGGISRHGIDENIEINALNTILLVTRGGGGLEDLLTFSDEEIVAAFSNSQMMIVSAIGHERDSPLCDFAADLRVSTPTQAMKVLRSREGLTNDLAIVNDNFLKASKNLLKYKDFELKDIKSRLAFSLNDFRRREEQGLAKLESQLKFSLNEIKNDNYSLYNSILSRFESATKAYVQLQRSKYDSIKERDKNLKLSLLKALFAFVSRKTEEKERLVLSLEKALRSYIKLQQNVCDNSRATFESLNSRFRKSILSYLIKKEEELSAVSHQLEMLGEGSVLARGYSIVFDNDENIITRVEQFKKGEEIKIQVSNGTVKLKLGEVEYAKK